MTFLKNYFKISKNILGKKIKMSDYSHQQIDRIKNLLRCVLDEYNINFDNLCNYDTYEKISEENVKKMVSEYGIPKNIAVKALRIHNNNIELALKYLKEKH